MTTTNTTDNFENSEAIPSGWISRAAGRTEAYSAIFDIIFHAPTVERDGNWRAEAQRKNALREYFAGIIEELEGEAALLNDQLRQAESLTSEGVVDSPIAHARGCLDSTRTKLAVVRQLKAFWIKGN